LKINVASVNGKLKALNIKWRGWSQDSGIYWHVGIMMNW